MGVAIHNPFPTIMPMDSEAEMMLPEELMNPDSLEMPEEGCLRGEGKQYTFSLEGQNKAFMQTMQNCLSNTLQPKEQQTFDAKTTSPSSFKFDEVKIRIKELKSSETEKTKLDSQENRPANQLNRTSGSVKQVFSNAVKNGMVKGDAAQGANRLPSHAHASGLNGKMPQTTRPSLERKASSSDTSSSKVDSRRQDNAHTASHLSGYNREIAKETPAERPKDYIKDEEQKERRQKKDDEDRGAADQEKHQQKHSQDQEEEELKVANAEKTTQTKESQTESFMTEFDRYAIEDSILSEICNMRISHFDVLVLFIEILKLEIKSREQERIARMQERELQILHMQKVVDNYKQQGRFLLFANLGAGLLAIASGACPVIGHVGGDWILGKLSSVFSALQGMEKDKLFKSLTKITFAMSEMYKSTGQIQQTFAEGNRTLDQHLSDLHRTDQEEMTRTMEEIKDFWKNIENFLFDTLRMVHEAIRQLYNV